MKKVLGVIVAAAAGYVAGILTAPKSGEETRKDLQSKKADLQRTATDKKEVAKEVLDESSVKAKKGAAEISDEAVEFGRKAQSSADKISKEASKLGTQAKRSLGRAADTAAKTGKDIGESVNKLR